MDKLTRPAPGSISAGFYQARPLSRPPEQRTHKHGAIDIAGGHNTPIHAPDDGVLYAFAAFRPGDVPRHIREITGRITDIPFDFQHYYWYDIYGGVFVLQNKEHTHVITHQYLNTMIKSGPTGKVRWRWTESQPDERWPVGMMHTFDSPVEVDRGDIIGYMGNAGYSTGPHIHWEIHRGHNWQTHAERINPEDMI